jgi:hypothetical protein
MCTFFSNEKHSQIYPQNQFAVKSEVWKSCDLEYEDTKPTAVQMTELNAALISKNLFTQKQFDVSFTNPSSRIRF